MDDLEFIKKHVLVNEERTPNRLERRIEDAIQNVYDRWKEAGHNRDKIEDIVVKFTNDSLARVLRKG